VIEEQNPQAALPPNPEMPLPPRPVSAPPTTPGAQKKDWTKATAGGFHWGTGRRKTAIARVRIRPGSGEFKVNKRDADVYFPRDTDRQAIRAPLHATEMLKKLDVFVNISGGGTTGQAGAIVLGLARALFNYDSQYEQVLRDGNYLTRDSRRVERKKYGQSGARRRFQFSKR
jgi:small subunit ribosomal protein S9